MASKNKHCMLKKTTYLRKIYCKPTIIRDTLFRDLPEIDWFAASYFQGQTLSTPVFLTQLNGKYWFAASNIRNEALANLAKIYSTRIKAGLQYNVICLR